MELLEKKCENVATLKSLLKEMAMVYQYDLKCEVARHMKCTWKDLDLPYKCGEVYVDPSGFVITDRGEKMSGRGPETDVKLVNYWTGEALSPKKE